MRHCLLQRRQIEPYWYWVACMNSHVIYFEVTEQTTSLTAIIVVRVHNSIYEAVVPSACTSHDRTSGSYISSYFHVLHLHLRLYFRHARHSRLPCKVNIGRKALGRDSS